MANGWRCCYCCWNEERTALLQLKANIKYSTSGDDYLSSWGANETSDCCRWEGIVCSNTTRRVVELSIIAKEEKLSNGTYTDDILGNWLFNASLFIPFKNLKALLLPGHYLAGWVKNEGLDKLEILDLSVNSLDLENVFSTLQINTSRMVLKKLDIKHHLRLLGLLKCNIGGDFPNWLLQNNFRLGEVYLDGNAFTGSLRLPFLPNLKALDISNNKIQGELPSNIGSIFPKLSMLLMSNNMLEGLARKGSKLYFLRLSNNLLDGEIFPALADINNLEYLYLDGNNFSGPIPQALVTAPFLSILDLSDNNLSGNIPAWLGNISSLKYLGLSRNHLKGHIPPDYCRLEGPEVLDLSENNLVVMIPSCFSAFRDLKHVHLSKNKLQGEFNMFSNSSYLQLLDLRDNNFSGSIPKWLGSTSDITILLLKGNRL
ncbi:hypothetical protein BC332_29480 [Capsicum chinense]|nr:hypothetical protein BC332_29480 [Capsicum chinense]